LACSRNKEVRCEAPACQASGARLEGGRVSHATRCRKRRSEQRHAGFEAPATQLDPHCELAAPTAPRQQPEPAPRPSPRGNTC
jgi:hypothetical protein